MKKSIYLASLLLTTLTACSTHSVNNISDPLPTYWQMKLNDRNFNDINYKLQKKLFEIEKELERLKRDDWNERVHSILANIQMIREQPYAPLPTTEKDDI